MIVGLVFYFGPWVLICGLFWFGVLCWARRLGVAA